MVSRRKLFAGAGMAPLAGTLIASARLAQPRNTTNEPQPATRRFAAPLSGREMMRRRYFPNLTLVTDTGRNVKFYDDLLKDKIVVLNFMYADCQGVCPTIVENLMRVRKILNAEVNRDVYFYSLTLRPEVDTPAALRQYAEMHSIRDPRWTFLTGKPEDMDSLRHLLGFADPDRVVDKDKTKHSGMVRYGNEPLSIWGSCQGSGQPEWMAREIQFAIPRECKRHPRVND